MAVSLPSWSTPRTLVWTEHPFKVSYSFRFCLVRTSTCGPSAPTCHPKRYRIPYKSIAPFFLSEAWTANRSRLRSVDVYSFPAFLMHLRHDDRLLEIRLQMEFFFFLYFLSDAICALTQGFRSSRSYTDSLRYWNIIFWSNKIVRTLK